MKKDVIITARVTHETKETIQCLADKDERALAWMIRKLILEALEARSLLKRDTVQGEAGEHDSRGKTGGTDMIREEVAAYGRDDEGVAGWIMQEGMLFITIPRLGIPRLLPGVESASTRPVRKSGRA